MADLFYISRTKLQARGRLGEETTERLHRTFVATSGDERVTMLVDYDEDDDITTIQLSPCIVVTDEYADIDDCEAVNYRATLAFDADALPEILERDANGHNIFIEQQWLPYKETELEKTVVLPTFLTRQDYVIFELLSVGVCCEKNDGKRSKLDRIKIVGTERRNEDMRKAKRFLMTCFATRLEEANHSNPMALLLDKISMVLADVLAKSVADAAV